jgi:hypothetical protein
LNVVPSQELCFEFGDVATATLTVETPLAVGGGALTASTGALPANVARVTGNQLQNDETLLQTSAWCFTAPTTGHAYVIFKSGSSLYLPIKIDVDARPRMFRTTSQLKADAGERYFGSVHRSYTDLSRQWADTPSGATPTINTDFILEQVSVRKASVSTDTTNPVSKGAFVVYIDAAGFTGCSEYADDEMFDTAVTPVALPTPTTTLTKLALVSDDGDYAREVTAWAFSWQMPATALDNDVHYVGLRCKKTGVTGADYSAMWKISITDKPTFTAASADLAKVTVNTAVEYTSFTNKVTGVWASSTTGTPPVPDPRWKGTNPVTKKIEV